MCYFAGIPPHWPLWLVVGLWSHEMVLWLAIDHGKWSGPVKKKPKKQKQNKPCIHRQKLGWICFRGHVLSLDLFQVPISIWEKNCMQRTCNLIKEVMSTQICWHPLWGKNGGCPTKVGMVPLKGRRWIPTWIFQWAGVWAGAWCDLQQAVVVAALWGRHCASWCPAWREVRPQGCGGSGCAQTGPLLNRHGSGVCLAGAGLLYKGCWQSLTSLPPAISLLCPGHSHSPPPQPRRWSSSLNV